MIELIETYPLYSVISFGILGFYFGHWSGFRAKTNERSDKIKVGKWKAKVKRLSKKIAILLFVFLVLGALFLFSSCSQTNKTNKPNNIACVEIYQPVCGKIEVQCIKAPCNPVQETFSNRCFAEARGAFDIQEGSCK